jgi:hypothetical protein
MRTPTGSWAIPDGHDRRLGLEVFESVAKLARSFRLHGVERLTALHALSYSHVKVDAGCARPRCAGELGDPRQAAIVYRQGHAGLRRLDYVRELRVGNRSHSALRGAYRLELGPGPSLVQRAARQGRPLSGRSGTGELEYRTGEPDGAVTKVAWRIGMALEHCEDISRLQGGTDSASNRLGAIRLLDPHLQPQR